MPASSTITYRRTPARGVAGTFPAPAGGRDVQPIPPGGLVTFANDASTNVLTGGLSAPGSGSLEVWTVASPSVFPSVSQGTTPATHFDVCDPQNPSEIIKVIWTWGATWLVVRGGAGPTTPVAHAPGFSVQLIISSGFLNAVPQSQSGVTTVYGALTTAPVVLTDAATIAMNAAQSDFFRVTLGGNRTLGAPSNPSDGQAIVIEVIQDGTGSRTLAYNAVYSFPASIGTPVLSSTPAFHDFLAFRYDSAATTWYCTGFVPQQAASTPYTVAQGGTGQSSLTAYTLLAGGTTSTGAVQQVAAGSTGQLLTSNGGSALPSWVSLDATASDIQQAGTAAAAGSTGKVPDAGHVHADPLALPADFAFQAWTFDPGSCNASSTATTSLMYLVRFSLRQTATLTNVVVHVTASSATLNSGQNYIAVYDSGGTCRAVTADQTSAWGTTGVKSVAFGAAYSNAPAGNYYLVVNVSVASATGPTFRAATAAASAFLMNTGLSASVLRCATQTAAVAIPTAGVSTLTLSSNVQTNACPLAAVFT